MRTGGLIATAILAALLIAGVTNAALVPLLPERLRGVPLVWLVTMILILGALGIAWRFRSRRSSR